MLSREQLMEVIKEVKEVATQDGSSKQFTLIYGNKRHIYFVDRQITDDTDFVSHMNEWVEDRRISTLEDFNISVYECYYFGDFDFLCDVLNLVGYHYAVVENGEWKLV